MTLSHWVDAAHRAAYERAYEAALGLWPIPHASAWVDTPLGTTHVVVSGNPTGAPLVLLPAASLSATQWYAQAAALGVAHRLFAVDILGDIGRSTQTTPLHSRADAAAWLRAVLDGLGIATASLVGASFGGFLAANLTTLAPERVHALALLAPAATLQPFATAARLFIRLGSLVPLPSTVRPGLRGMMGGRLPDARLVEQMERGVAGFRYDRAGLFPGALPDGDLRRIACPTLVLVGADERIYDAARAVARARALIPQGTTAVLPGLGHLLSLQDPATVNAHLGDFLVGRH